jgi:5-formyltetrahydrofolate cyclo-ligase
VTISKSDLRNVKRYERQAFVKSNENVQTAFNRRIERLAPLIERCAVMAAYQSFGSEVSTAAAIALAHAMGKAIALPFIAHANDTMSFKRWAPSDPLVTQAFGFRQPSEDATDSYPDLILVPLVGFDRDMNRLGQGGGYYDRYLSRNNKTLKVGIAWSCQEVSVLPVDEWDVRLDGILTEKDWIVGSNSVIAK